VAVGIEALGLEASASPPCPIVTLNCGGHIFVGGFIRADSCRANEEEGEKA